LWTVVLPHCVFFFHDFFFFFNFGIWEDFVVKSLGVIGVALLVWPLYHTPEQLDGIYRRVDKAVALLPVLAVVFGILGVFMLATDASDPPPYIGFTRVYAFSRPALIIAVYLLWAFAFFASKGRLAITAALCCIAFNSMPYPTVNNQFALTIVDMETDAYRHLSQEDIDAFMSHELDPNAIELSPPDGNPSIVMSSPHNSVVISDHSSIILLTAYTFMRFGRKRRNMSAETLSQPHTSGAAIQEDASAAIIEETNRADEEQA